MGFDPLQVQNFKNLLSQKTKQNSGKEKKLQEPFYF